MSSVSMRAVVRPTSRQVKRSDDCRDQGSLGAATCRNDHWAGAVFSNPPPARVLDSSPEICKTPFENRWDAQKQTRVHGFLPATLKTPAR
jgi:hypothetical protein